MEAYGKLDLDSSTIADSGIASASKPMSHSDADTLAKRAQSSSSSFGSAQHLNHSVDHESLAANGALLGAGWEWLDLDHKTLSDLNIDTPSSWKGETRGWHGDWYEVARHMSSVDFDYLVASPLTLYIPSHNTYLVHAGMRASHLLTPKRSPLTLSIVPWSEDTISRMRQPADDPTVLHTATVEASPLTSVSKTSFIPTYTTHSLLSEPDRSLLLVESNTDPFTLLNMRAVKSKKGREFVVTKGKKGTPWYNIWEKGMESYCSDIKYECTPISVVYGHWAGQGLTLNPLSIGLDSGCVYGNRLSALVIPVSPYAKSPLETASGFVKRQSEDATLSKSSSSITTSTSPTHAVPTDDVTDADDVDDEESAKSATGDSLPYEEEAVTLAGRRAWVVSVSCSLS